ncbi:MAG: glycosyltransferase family 4 protein [Mucilaginibacter sp.]|uniref:glycosyltransferase family 4 protein n=1 Tax=Mucilaginibacter sp. TaxID=1882438 RepID=UPI003263D0B2
MEKRIKVLLYSHYFYPALGGLENVSLTLAEGFTQNQIDCKVITTSPDNGTKSFPFEVIRNPKTKQQIDLVKWCDIVLFNGASLALQPWVVFYNKPFIWVHQSYLVSCIDGLGWVEGEKAPLKPFASFLYHTRLKGVRWGVTQGLKLSIKRLFAKCFVKKNVAITKWVQDIEPLPRQIQIYNPFPLDQFLSNNNNNPEYDFIYLGRIVSEKGVSTLLKAFAKLHQKISYNPKLLLVGDGNWRPKMESLANKLNISEFITFAGKKSGSELVEFVSKGKIAVVPSEWYEPMGGVALELMAAGKILIVSEFGGLKECVEDAGLTFPNGDFEALSNCMLKLLEDEGLQNELKLRGKERIKLFHPSIFVAQYIDLIKQLL